MSHTHPVYLYAICHIDLWLTQRTQAEQAWFNQQKPNIGQPLCHYDQQGQLDFVVIPIQQTDLPWCLGGLALTLPEREYTLITDIPESMYALALGWSLGAYQYTAYKTPSRQPATLTCEQIDRDRLTQEIAAVTRVRDLVNTPANALMPQQLADITRTIAQQYAAHCIVLEGDELLKHNYPTIHLVGRASIHQPCLIDLRWGNPKHPHITLVGKGVCFDSGGLDLKPASGMRLMKKDMGGAAHALALAEWIMAAQLPIALRLLIPAVENAVSGDSFRPGDVVISRAGLGIEIDNTDAEGRLILCDALTEAASESPDLIIDFATLTGAARVALGTELPALFSNNMQLSCDLMAQAERVDDPLWPMPLHKPYQRYLKSSITDLANASSQPYAGAITAALFLQAFIPEQQNWLHLDLMAWNISAQAGRPEGGEAMGLRALFSLLSHRYAHQND